MNRTSMGRPKITVTTAPRGVEMGSGGRPAGQVFASRLVLTSGGRRLKIMCLTLCGHVQ